MTARSCLAAVAIAPLMMALAPTPQPGLGWPEFDAKVVEAKSDMMGEPAKALGAAEESLKLAQARSRDAKAMRAMATGGWLKGEALIRLNRTREAAPVIETALQQARKAAPGEKLEGDLLKARGTLEATLGRVQPALADFQQAFEVFRKADIPRSQAIVLQDIGSIYSDARDFERTIKYYKQSAELFKDDPAVALAARNNLGNALMQMGRTKEARVEFVEALKIAQSMSSPQLEVRVLPNLAVTEADLGDFAAAESRIDQAFRLGQRDPAAREWLKPYVWGAKAKLEFARGRTADAARSIEQAFEGPKLDSTDLQYRDLHKIAWQIYSKLGDSSAALKHLTAYKKIDDQVRDLAASTNAALMSAKFDFANQDLKIERLRAGQLARDVALAKAKARGQTLLIGAGALVTLMSLVGVYLMRRSRDQVKRVNADLERALKAKTEFLATTSHEIRTPLNGILGMTQVMLADGSVQPVLRSRIEVVHAAGEAMRALVDDLLDVAKMETGKITVSPAVMDLRRLLEETHRLWRGQAENKGLTLTLDLADDLPRRIVEDEARLRQILVNLLSNAIKFTQAGEVTLAVALASDRIRFQVRDMGIGIAPEDQERIFEAFTQIDGGVTRQHSGTGLGLAICRDVAKALGGSVTVQSRVGEGSTFTLDLPLKVAEEAAAPHRAAVTDLAAAAVLILEVNPLARAVLRASLQAEAQRVEVTDSLDGALQHLGSDTFDHVLVAAEALGEGVVDGARALVAAAPPRQVSVLLRDGAPEQMASLMASGVGQIVMRPLSPEALVAALRAGLAAAAQDAPASSPVSQAA